MGFKSFKSYGSRVAIPTIIKVIVPPAVNNVVLIAGGDNGTIALSSDNGVSWTLPSNQPFVTRSITCAFDGKRIVMGGREDIAYSDDFGNTWVSTGFASMLYIYQVLYVAKTKRWIAVGFSNTNNTIAYSDDGINWTLSNPIFAIRCYDVIHNGTVYIAVGWGEYSMATSSDGISWAYNTTFRLTANTQYSYCIFNDGSRYILGSRNDSGGNIATSSDGITWVNEGYVPMDISRIAYNGNTYVAVGNNGGYYHSNDLKTWITPATKLTGQGYWVDWNGTYFVMGARPISGSTVNIIYSTDGKNWTASDNTQITGTVHGISSITSPPPPIARTYKTISTLLSDSNNVYSNRFDSNGVLYFGGIGILQKYVNNTAIVVAGNGTNGFSGDGGQATSASMGEILGIAFDTVGNIYLADLTYHVIRKIDIVSGVISTVAGTGGSAGNSGQGGLATSALLNNVRDVLIDSNNNMYIVCSGSNVINKIDTNGIITTIAGTSTSGYTGDGGQATACTMNNPAQLSLYKNSLYFADGSNFVIRKIDLNTGIITTVVGQGNNTHSGDGGQATLANLQFPRGVIFDNLGNMYISEKPYIRKVDLDGVISTIAGNGSNANTGDGGDPLLATFGQAFTLAFDSNYFLYICDAFNKNMRVLS